MSPFEDDEVIDWPNVDDSTSTNLPVFMRLHRPNMDCQFAGPRVSSTPSYSPAVSAGDEPMSIHLLEHHFIVDAPLALRFTSVQSSTLNLDRQIPI